MPPRIFLLALLLAAGPPHPGGVPARDGAGSSPTAACEAAPPARCWYVAADASGRGDGSAGSPFRRPQDAVDRAEPGDFIYLRGGAEFTHDHAVRGILVSATSRNAANGAPGRLITLKSHPGEQAVIRGLAVDGVPRENLGIRISRSHWKVEGLRIIHGAICVACNVMPDIEDVWVVGNHISDAVASVGNFGMITISGQTTQGGPVAEVDPRDIHIHDNVVHTLWGVQPRGGDPLPWHEDRDVEHHACLMIHRASGLVEIVGNDFSECATIFYSKFTGPGPTVARDNYFHDARTIAYRWRSSRPRFENNVFARFERPDASFDIVQGGPVEEAVFRNNTFDLGPWAMNAEGTRGGMGWNDLPHVFRDNVVFGSGYNARTPARSSDIDGNCLIGPPGSASAPSRSRSRADALTWEQYRSTFGFDRNGRRVVERRAEAAFRDPAGGDYTLMGEAATLCAGKGATLPSKAERRAGGGGA